MGGNSGRDARSSRRLTGWAEWFWYVAAAVSYVVFGIFHKFLLNWFVGPVWLVAAIGIGPWMVDRLRRRVQSVA